MENNESSQTFTSSMVGIQRASEITGYSVKYLYKLTSQKRIRHYKPQAGRIFFRIQDLEEFMSQGVVLADYDLEKIAEEKLASINNRKSKKV